MNDNTRDQALDRLRGAAVLGMILVVSPGSWTHRSPFLDHAVWNGWTAADIVMPMFLFCVGLAIPLSTRSSTGFFQIVRRTLALVLLGLLLNLLPDFDLAKFRIPGVLQRIGVCYFIGASVYYLINNKFKLEYPISVFSYAVGLVILLMTNYLLMHTIQVPGPDSSLVWGEGVFSAHIDQIAFGAHHLWPWAVVDQYGFIHDPDGIVSTLFASSAVLCGTMFTLARKHFSERRWWQPLQFGAPLVALGLLLDSVVPINKVIWSVSFSLLSVGMTLLILSVLELSSRRLRDKFFILFDVLGSNAVLAFILSTILLAYHGVPIIAGKSAQALMFKWVQMLVANPHLASLFCAVLVAVLIFALLFPLHRRRLFLRL